MRARIDEGSKKVSSRGSKKVFIGITSQLMHALILIRMGIETRVQHKDLVRADWKMNWSLEKQVLRYGISRHSLRVEAEGDL